MKLEIPEAAYIAAANAYDKADPDQCWSDSVDAAAPLVIAVELRRLADELHSYEISSPGLAIAIGHILNRITELKQQQVTVAQHS
jgi:hypothetical protein